MSESLLYDLIIYKKGISPSNLLELRSVSAEELSNFIKFYHQAQRPFFPKQSIYVQGEIGALVSFSQIQDSQVSVISKSSEKTSDRVPLESFLSG